MNCRINPILGLMFISILGVTACSNNQGGVSSEAKAKKAVLHTHPANKCIDAVSHAHLEGNKKHSHYFHFCESGNKNAHSHPSSSITGFTRHVHPNGANPHTHGG